MNGKTSRPSRSTSPSHSRGSSGAGPAGSRSLISSGVARRRAGVSGSVSRSTSASTVRCPSARMVSRSRASGSPGGANGLAGDWSISVTGRFSLSRRRDGGQPAGGGGVDRVVRARVGAHHELERVAVELVEARRHRGGHGRGARYVAQQGDLAYVLAGPALGQAAAAGV